MKYKFKNLQNINFFYDELHSDIKLLIEELENKGVGIALVGGAVRDYLLEGQLPKDLDFEVYPLHNISEPSWIKLIKSTFDQRFEKNDFNVHRICLAEYELEFAPSRFETYAETDDAYSHSDFDVEYLTDFTPSKSFLRRDFTCNAMAIHIVNSTAIFIDPFDGISSLENKEIHFCSNSFKKDPVRFLRAIRFSLLYNLSFSKDLKAELSKMNLEKLSEYYLFKEAFKSNNFFLYINTLFSTLEDNQKTPEYFKYLKQMNMKLDYYPNDKFELMLGMIVNGIDLETLIELNTLFQFKKGYIAKWKKFLENLDCLDKNNFFLIDDFTVFLANPKKDIYLDVFKQANNLKVSMERLSLIDSLDRELFGKIKLVEKLLRVPKKPKNDYADIKTENRKYLQAFEFFKAR